MTLSTPLLKQRIGRLVAPYWSRTKTNYWGFNDPDYELLSDTVWRDLTGSVPPMAYRVHVYDCEDHAMEFKVHVARRQHEFYAGFPSPFAVGMAGGHFAFVPEFHALNFAFMNDGSMAFFDPFSRLRHPFSAMQVGLNWILM